MINGEYFFDSSFFRFRSCQFLLGLKYIFIRCHAGSVHILCGIHVPPGQQELLFSFFQLFLIIRHFPATDHCQHFSFVNKVSYFGTQFRHGSSEHRIHICHLILIESDPSIQCQFIYHFTDVHGIDGYDSQQAVRQA